ncbi:MAG TPA: undecaprenyldiphospho-muramoylpentapeptide beta-N-acetylglucosaminyltransferase [Chitinophagaceae bacterium]|jgi:UDP-N-acetylglucosamine--N-acetylmuramyl-(pentapeptide) pyrophosphoryl-undecaprenol N-acetylglucosamine transferase|nr:undecaprenyldiphospho-muramoylpentapeptide beta-N-acetylglucosaminyltransferase [Chitinophagaceae bacterium]
MSKKVIIAGGGTGGHIFPAIAIANALKKLQPKTELLFVGANGKMEMEKVPQAGYKIQGIDMAGFNRSSLLKNLSLPFRLVKSFFQVRNIFGDFLPDVVIGVGGYSSFPVLKYAQKKGIPTFIHESNSFAGKANKLLGARAEKVFVAAHGMEQFFPKSKIVLTGNPVRTNISESRITREEGILFFGLDPEKKTVLSVGGSLGAQSINEAIAAGIDNFAANGLQLIWQTGKPFIEQAKQVSDGKENIYVSDFINQMEYALAAADVVISRAGAMAIAELCLMGKPVVFVPYPFAAEDHQTVNARALVIRNAGLMIPDHEAKEKLVPMITDLARDGNWQQTLKTNIRELSFVDADTRIAAEIFKTIDSQTVGAV